jgi:outer membrane receptor protein involved in Fe transport
MNPCRFSAATAAALLGFPLLSAAAPSPHDLARKLDAMQVTATRHAESMHDVSAAMTVLDSEDIRSAAAQTAMDLLHGEVGTFVQQTTPGQAIAIVRGLKGSEVLHLVDGFRLNNAFFRNAPNQYMALVDGRSLDRIEVVRGPASAWYGGDAMGGVVQMFTPDPRMEGPRWSARGLLQSQYASADDASLSRLEGVVGHDGITLSGGATYQDVGELRVGGGEHRPFTDYTAKAANGKIDLGFGEGHELMLQTQWLEQPSTSRIDELVAGYGQTRPNSVEFAFEPQARRFTQARYRHRGEALLWDQLDAQAGRQTIVDDRRSRESGSPNREREANSSKLDGVSLQMGKRLGDHYFTYGGDYYSDTVRSERVRENIDSGAISARPPRFPDGSTMDQLGLFVADDWSMGRIDLNGALRYSRVDTRLAPLGEFAVDVEDDDLSANLGTSFALTDEWHLVSNLGRAFRPPNVFDLGTFGDRPGNRFNIPNPELRPERVVSLDFGVKHRGPRWAAEAFVFASRYRDKITSVLTGETTASGRLIVQSRNATRLDLQGVEIGARGLLRPGLDAYFSATHTRGEERFDGDEYAADRIPPLYGKLGLAWRPTDRVQLEGYAFYAGRQERLSPRDAIDPRLDPNGTGGWASWNALAAYRVNDRLDISLRLENLGDKRYREHGSGLEEPGRNAVLGASVEF